MAIEYRKLGLFALGADAAATIAASILLPPLPEYEIGDRIADGEGYDHTPDMTLTEY